MSGRKILIIDDDVTALDIVDYLFEDRGFHVVRRADGKSALDSVTDVNPEIILVDLMMPLMNGQECVRRLRSMGYQVPIVAFTAIDDPEIHADAISAGCDMVLTKPCRPNALLAKIEELLDSKTA